MVFLYFSDLVPVFISSILFSSLAMAHRILVPSKYSSFLQFKQEEDEKRTAQSTLIRIIYLISGTLFLYKICNFTEMQIAIGIFIACFLNTWPAIVENHLLKIVKTKMEWMLLLGYFVFIIFSIFVELVTIRLFLPILLGDKSIYWIDNQAISLFASLILMVIPIPVEAIIAKCTHIVIVQRIDTFREEVYICEKQLNMSYRYVDNNKYIIDVKARESDINIKLIETIIKLESFYRERLYYRFFEKVLTKYFCDFAIKRDISVGVAQIKISTAEKILRQNPYLFVKSLCNDEVNIELCAKYIKILISEYFDGLESEEKYYIKENFVDVYDYIACRYLGGVPYNKEKTILIYSAVLRSVLTDFPLYYAGSIDCKRYLVLISSHKEISYEEYEMLKEKIKSNGTIQKEIFLNGKECMLEIEFICEYLYQLQEIRKVVETYKLDINIKSNHVLY